MSGALPSPLLAPSTVTLAPSSWRAAARLAGLRKAVNDRQRSAHRSRGDAKNLLNDLQGAIGELVALIAVAAAGVTAVRHNPISFAAHIDDVDIAFEWAGSEGEVGLEAKCLLVEPGKRLFLVNQRAHERSLVRGAAGFLPILTAEGAPQALVGCFVPATALHGWREYNFQYGDPAIGIPFSVACRKLFQRPEQEVREGFTRIAGRHGTLTGTLGEEADFAAEHLERFERELPPLENATAAQLVHALCAVRA